MGNLVAEMRIYDVYLMLHDQVPLENAEHGFFIPHFSFLSFCFSLPSLAPFTKNKSQTPQWMSIKKKDKNQTLAE